MEFVRREIMEAKYQRFLPIEEKSKRSLAKSVELRESGNSATPWVWIVSSGETEVTFEHISSQFCLLYLPCTIYLFLAFKSKFHVQPHSKEPTNKRYELRDSQIWLHLISNRISYRCKNSDSNIKFGRIDDKILSIFIDMRVYTYIYVVKYKSVM